MAYGDFTLDIIEDRFNISTRVRNIFESPVEIVQPSQRLTEDIEEAASYPLRTEKAKSEWVVTPILKELRRKNAGFFTVYSGETLAADPKKGLNGECDFIVARDIGSYTISFPIMQIVEAKKGDIDLGIPQCAAQMVGARVYNQHKKTPIDVIYGCVTTGKEWQFMKLSDKIYIDDKTYKLEDLSKILGAFQTIIDYYKMTLKDTPSV